MAEDTGKRYGVFIQWGENRTPLYACWSARANSVEEVRERARKEKHYWYGKDNKLEATLLGADGEIEIFDPLTGAVL